MLENILNVGKFNGVYDLWFLEFNDVWNMEFELECVKVLWLFLLGIVDFYFFMILL